MKNIKVQIGLMVGFLAFVGVVALNPSSALAATKTWTGTAGDHKFNTSGNWSPSGAPSNGDDLVFPNGVTDKSPDNDIVGLSVAGITFSGGGSQGFTITGNSFTSTAGITFTTTTNYTYTTISAPIVFSGNQTIATNSLTGLALSGAISGSGNIDKTGTGILYLTADNSSYSGSITNSAGLLQIENANALGSTGGNTTIASGAVLAICYSADTTIAEPLSIAGDGDSNYGAINVSSCASSAELNAVLNWTGAVTLTGNTVVSGYNANILKLSGDLSGGYSISIEDGVDATLIIESSNNTSETPNGTYHSAMKTTTIAAGDDQPSTFVYIYRNNTYIINGIRGDTQVFEGGFLKGTGTVGDLSSDGTVAPGESPGCLTSGNATLNGSFNVEIGGTTVCTDYDQLIVNGSLTLFSNLSVSRFNDFKPEADQVYTIISNDGSDAVLGTFVGLDEGATINVDGYVLRVSYVGGDGNDVTLTVVSVPGVPDTGFKLITGSPIIVSLVGVASVIVAFLVGRRMFAR